MATIKIICGAYGYRPPERPGTVKTIRAGETCEVSNEEATRLISLGVAEFATQEAVATPHAPHSEGGGGNDTPDQDKGQKMALDGLEVPDTLDIVCGHFTAESLGTMTNKALADLAADLGLDAKACKNKADYVALLSSVELDMADQDEGDEPPTPSAELPV